jgi:hypothetical protein
LRRDRKPAAAPASEALQRLEIVQRCIVRKSVLVLALLALLVSVLTFPALADEKTVNATVQPVVIALNVDPANVTYGARPLSVTASEPNSPIGVTNTGSVTEQFLIRGAASTPGNWTLGMTAGNNVYVHRFKLSVSSTFVPLTTNNQLLKSNVLPDAPSPGQGSFLLNLNLDMPTGTTSVLEQTLPVTVVAIQQP